MDRTEKEPPQQQALSKPPRPPQHNHNASTSSTTHLSNGSAVTPIHSATTISPSYDVVPQSVVDGNGIGDVVDRINAYGASRLNTVTGTPIRTSYNGDSTVVGDGSTVASPYKTYPNSNIIDERSLTEPNSSPNQPKAEHTQPQSYPVQRRFQQQEERSPSTDGMSRTGQGSNAVAGTNGMGRHRTRQRRASSPTAGATDAVQVALPPQPLC